MPKDKRDRKLYFREYKRTHKARSTEMRRELRYKHPERERNNKLKSRYGITSQKFDELCALQNNQCAICKKIPSKLHVDHDHVNGNVRELLCNKCNRGIGWFNEDIERLKKAIEYLEKWKTNEHNH